MTDSIFLLDGDDLKEMALRRYDSESLLQRLVAQHPNVLSGVNTSDDGGALPWLLIKREAGIPDAEDSAARWSLDHLFLDRDGIPTLIEVKRSSDTRIRREVVGQLLDYAANSVIYWPLGTIQGFFEMTVAEMRPGTDADDVLRDFLGPDSDPADFWQDVKTNLQAGRIRLVFVADEIPRELQRIIEFLNEQMDPAEVLGIEVRQYVGSGATSLVPKLVGRTAASEGRKTVAGGQKRKWDEDSFFRQVRERHGHDGLRVTRRLYEWAVDRGLRIWWGEGKEHGSFAAMLDLADEAQYVFSLRGLQNSLWVEISFARMLGPFADEVLRDELRGRLNRIPGVSLSRDSLYKYPSIQVEQLESPDAIAAFLAAFEWFLGEHAE